MRLGWYWNRLRSMSPSEIVHRVIEQTKKSKARKMMGAWDQFRSDEPCPLPVLPGFARAIDMAPLALREDAAKAAQDIVGGHFSALGVTWPQFEIGEGKDAIWHLDPVTGGHWPSERYCFDVNYRGSTEMGDIKYTWEFSRLQFLQSVALHARLSDDAEALAFIERAIISWHASNPPFQGVGWSSGIELSLRAISLLVVASLVGDRLNSETAQAICEILRGHVFWIKRYPSKFSSANNHLVSEEAALYLISMTCPFIDGAEQIAAHAKAALVRETVLQIHVDGVAAEQSPTYGALTSELLLLCVWAADQLGTPMPASVLTRLRAFADWIHWLAEPDGTIPAIGDDDEGRVLTLGQDEPTYATSVAATIAILTEQPERVPPHVPTFRNALVPPMAAAPLPSGTRSFEEGGYTVNRQRIDGHDVTLVIDHAPLGYLAIAAHGHADALAFTLAVDGEPLFVDPGTYLYHSGHEWRDWFRNTRAHNTVVVEDAEQSVISGAFNWSHKANARIEKVSTTPAEFVLQASHDGYQGRFGVRHVRRFAVGDGVLTLHDALVGGESREAEIVFQLSPRCDIVEVNSAIEVLRDGKRIVRIVFPLNGIVTHTCGEDRPEGGWVSPRFGAKVPATRVAWRGQIGAKGVTTYIAIG